MPAISINSYKVRDVLVSKNMLGGAGFTDISSSLPSLHTLAPAPSGRVSRSTSTTSTLSRVESGTVYVQMSEQEREDEGKGKAQIVLVFPHPSFVPKAVVAARNAMVYTAVLHWLDGLLPDNV